MKRKKTVRIIIICIAAAAVLAVGAAAIHYIGLRPILDVEFGSPLPDVASFAKEGDRYAGEYGVLPVGTHWIKVVHNGVPTPVLVRVRDTVAPTASAREATITYGQTLTPDKLITRIRDASVVAVTFSEPFDFDRIGDFDATIRLEDASGNSSTVESRIHIRAVTDGISLEAGAPLPDADAFLLDGVTAELSSTLSPDMMHHVGTYPVRFTLKNGQIAETTLTVSDTTPPDGASTFLWIRPDEPLLPEMLVDGVADETTLTYAFLTEPDPTVMHAQEVSVRMTDEGGNVTDVVSTIAITRIEPITVEISKEPLVPEQLGEGEIVLDEPFVPDTPGIYTVTVTINGEPDYLLVTAVDTTAPTVEKRADAKLYTNHTVPADAAFAAEDLSPVTVEWSTEPDWTLPGEQTVRVKATDRYGNETEQEDTVTLLVDEEPPVLYGVVDRTTYVGEPIAYLAEVYAEDDVDGRVEVRVESSVQTDRAGTYDVIYTATDTSGNVVTAKCRFKLVSPTVSEEEVKKLAQTVLSSIITDDMVTAEKLKAVFDYVRGHVTYVGSSDKTDWRKEAIRGINSGRGDCFTFYSVTRALLDELDIDYMSVTRLGGRTRHFWVIVNIGTGWYHFDPTIAPHHKHKCFMWTNEQCQVKAYFWRYERSKYPDVATEKFNYDEVVRMEREGLLP